MRIYRRISNGLQYHCFPGKMIDGKVEVRLIGEGSALKVSRMKLERFRAQFVMCEPKPEEGPKKRGRPSKPKEAKIERPSCPRCDTYNDPNRIYCKGCKALTNNFRGEFPARP